MKNNQKFKFKYSSLVLSLLIFVIIVSIVGLAWSIYNLVKHENGSVNIATSIFNYVILLINVLILAFSLSVLLCARYEIHNEFVLCRFGIVKTKYKMAEIVSFTHFKKTDTLVMYFSSQEFTVIVISPEKFNDFVKSVRQINSLISFEDEEKDLEN